MAQFAEELNHQQPVVSSRRVVDSTSIEGSWDLTFSYRIVPSRPHQGKQQIRREVFPFLMRLISSWN